MIRISVMYGNGEGKKFDYDYYAGKHMALVHKRLDGRGLIRSEVDRGLAGGAPGAPAPCLAIGHLYFKSFEEFQAAIQPHAKELFDDVPNFTNILPQVQVSEILG